MARVPADFGVDRFSVAAVLDARAEQFPDRVMMSIDGADVTFEQMRRRSCAAASALLDMGVGPGDGDVVEEAIVGREIEVAVLGNRQPRAGRRLGTVRRIADRIGINLVRAIGG